MHIPGFDRKELALLPMADMLNHQYGSVTWKDGHGMFEIHSKKYYNPGEEVFNSYGKKGNELLFLYYGFALLDNPFDVYKLSWNMAEEAPVPEWKESLLSSFALAR